MARQPDHLKGTFLGIPDPVKPAWQGYDRRDIESHAEQVHYDVLRESGFDKDRARQISRTSANRQGYLLDEHRGERGIFVPNVNPKALVRYKTPYWGEHAGKLCIELADGTLTPVPPPEETP